MQAVAREPVPGALVLPVGLAVVIVAGEVATLSGTTAGLAGPFVIVLAVAGLLLAPPWPVRGWAWPAAAATAVYAVYAAPIVLSGQATFAGYIKLDDTATYFAMTDRVLTHARSLAGLAPSTYEATLATTIKTGYPTGSLMPLGIGHQLTGYDIAWLYQPYLTFMAAMLALALYAVLELAIPRPLRAVAAFLAAQPAILFGYALWGGIKELSGAWLLAAVAALVPWTLGSRRSPLAVVHLAAVCAALICVLSLPGGVWLVPALVAAVVVIAIRPERALLERVGVFALALGVLAVPAFVASVNFLGQVGDYNSSTELGNLIPPGLSKLQLFGIWPGGDFRLRHDPAPVKVLIALVIAAAAAGLWWAWRRESWALLLYVAVAGIGCAIYLAVSSPWVGGKTIAMASPAFLAAAFAACSWGVMRGHVVEAAVVAVAIAGGVLVSNWDQYHDVWLAPRGQLHELETIGHRISGQGPALMTDYQVYGVRHFLRSADPEGASELRRRYDYLTNGKVLPPKTPWADIDRFRLDGVLVYRTLVLRRGPLSSRPPSSYRLLWSGRYYEVWQRPAQQPNRIVDHLGLDTSLQPARVPACTDVMRLAHEPGVAALAAASRPQTIWLGAPPLSGERDVTVTVPAAGEYFAWLGGDWYGNASISVDGRKVGSRREELNWPGLYTELGRVRLAPGTHKVGIRYATGGWHPGSGALPYSFGPAALSPVDDREPFRTVPVSAARSLCGQRLDWVEALR